MAYTDRVNILAEKMALVKYPTRIENDRVWNSVVSDFIPLAEIALQDTSDIAKDAYKAGYERREVNQSYQPTYYINSLGLVPDKK